MLPSRLDDVALRFELKIRDAAYEEGRDMTNQRTLRRLIREEVADESKRPKPVLNPDDEITKAHMYFNELLEETASSSFKRSGSKFDSLYARFCHVEGRMVYMDWELKATEGTKQLCEGLVKKMEEFRVKFFADKPPYIVRTQRDGEGIPSKEEMEKHRKDMEEMEQKLAAMKLKQAKMTQANVSLEVEFEDTLTDDEEEDIEENIREAARLRKQRDELLEEQKKVILDGQKNLREKAASEKVAPENGAHENVGKVTSPPRVTRKEDSHSQMFPVLPPNQVLNPQNQSLYANNENLDDSFRQNIRMNSTGRSSVLSKANSLPMHKWKFAFEGQADGEIIAFIKDIENMASSQGMSTEDLRRGISTLLKGKAHDWYRAYGCQCGLWSDFIMRIKEEYLPMDFNHRVNDEIRQTIQKESETFQEFCVRIELVFMKLSYTMMEEVKLDHIKHNMHRVYKTADVLKLKTIMELRDACRFVDSINDERFKKVVNQRVEKPANFKPRINEVEMKQTEDYRQDFKEEEIPSSAASMCNEQTVQQQIQELQAATREFRRNPPAMRPVMGNQMCYNCRQPGHYASACRLPKPEFTCYGCGARGVIRKNCGNCQNQIRRVQQVNPHPQNSGNDQNTQ
jgi:Zinc knuckle